ncbi:hypothetical protein OIU77_014425 [Salix suchowensis]|uniref:Uncharacterized protein n=1 Tax=Salix suchowensis TaxID=1278906 RepID=A0ABQ8ZX81_9ROSI|nr:hypothetical protein OIU77_014425 [Salix suchowensis]
MSSLGTSKGILEIAKFSVYVTVPIVLMYAFANNTKNLQKFMGNVCISLSISPLSIGICRGFFFLVKLLTKLISACSALARKMLRFLFCFLMELVALHLIIAFVVCS